MTDSEILKKIMNHYNMTASKFAKFIEISSAQRLYDILNERNGISKDLRNKIHAKCVDISLPWLLTGKGEMLRNTPKTTNTSQNIPNQEQQLNKLIENLERRDKQTDRFIEHLESRISDKDELIKSLRDQIELLKSNKKTIAPLDGGAMNADAEGFSDK